MGNATQLAIHTVGEGRCARNAFCGSCYTTGMLDRDEFAIHKEIGIPKGRLVPDAMKYLDETEVQLMYACAGTNVSSVRWHLNQGASANTVDENRTSALHIACRQGSLQIVEELLHNGGQVNLADCAGWTCLHVASYCSRAHIVYVLLKYGADATIGNRQGETSWDLAGDEMTQDIFEKYWGERQVELEQQTQRQSATPQRHKYYLAMKHRISEVGRPMTPLVEIGEGQWDVLGRQFQCYLPVGVDKDIQGVCERIFNFNPFKGIILMAAFGQFQVEPQKVAEFLF